MAARQRLAAHVRGPLPPFGERLEALFDHAMRAPQREEIARDLLPFSERGTVVIEVDRDARAVVLADAVRGGRV